jgi:hypothetical protein
MPPSVGIAADMVRTVLGASRRLRVPLFVALLTLSALVACGFAALHLLRQPKLSARLAARAVATVAHEQLVQSVEVVGGRLTIGSLCLPGQEPNSSEIRLDTGGTVTVTPQHVTGFEARQRHDLLAIEALLAGCPRELERLIFPRVAIRFERHEPIGLRAVLLGGQRAYKLVFRRSDLRIAVVFTASTLRPVKIVVQLGRLSGWSLLQPVVSGVGRPLIGMATPA